MARYCSKCERKFGFFEEEFGGMCKECYYKFLEEAREKRIREAKEEEEKRREEQRKLEEKRQEEEENKKILEQEKKEQDIKYKEFKAKFMDNEIAMKLYINLIEKLEENSFSSIFINKSEHKRDTADGINLFIKNIIYMLPKDIKLSDVEKLDNGKYCLDIIEKNKDILEFGKFVDNVVYNNIKKDENESNTPKIECFEDCIYINSMELLEKAIIEKKIDDDYTHKKCRDRIAQFSGFGGEYYREEYSLKGLLISYELMFYWALIYIYNVVFIKYMDIFKASELNTIYCKLKDNTDDIVYVSDKVYELYSKLYKNLFDVEFKESHIYNIIQCCIYNNLSDNIVNEKLLGLDKKYINEQKLKFQDNMTTTDKFKIICKDILNNELIKTYLVHQLEEINSIKENIIFKIINIILNKFDLIDDVDVLDIDSLEEYNNIILNIIEDVKNEEQLEEAKKERDRILNGDFSKEIEMQKQEVEYSNVQNGYEFEEYVANLYRKLGYEIEEVTKKSGDQGADVIAYKDDEKYVIQVKFYNNPVGNKAVQEVVGAIGMYNANKGIVVTNSSFTKQAIELANANNIELVDGERIEQYKKEVIKDISSYVEELSEDYIDSITDKWNSRLEQENITMIDETNFNKCFTMLAKVYVEMNGTEDKFYEDNKLESFARAFSKYTSCGDNVVIEDRKDKDLIQTYLKKSIYKEHFITSRLDSILENNNIDEEERKKRIYYEYFLENMENILELYKLMALEEVLNETNEELVKEIEYYKERFEKEGAEYLVSRSEEVLDRLRRAMEEIGGNSEDYNLDNDEYNMLDYNNDFEEDNTFNFLDNDDYNDDYNDIFDE